MTESLPVRVARVPRVDVAGTFLRHAALPNTTLAGSPSGGRWAPVGAFPVLYVGRPRDSVTVEAYRHLVESVEGMRPELVAPRRLMTLSVSLPNVLDLRPVENQVLVGLTEADLTTEVGDYSACQAVARAAHQLGAKGVIAPAATGLGETLALFMSHVTASEMPIVTANAVWEHLPVDPRRLRSVDDQAG